MRTVWNGSINLALLSVGVKMYKASGESKINFRMIHQDCGTPMSKKNWCKKCDREVKWEELVKGYPADESHFVLFSDEELDSLTEGGDKTIKIDECIELCNLDLTWFSEFYYLIPQKGFDRAYLLLRESMQNTNVSLIGKWTYRGKEKIVSIMAHDGYLLTSVLKYAEELSVIQELPKLPEAEMPSTEEIGLGVELLKKFKKTEFVLPDSSNYMKRFSELMDAKAKGALEKSIAGDTKKPEKVKPSDLMASLRASVESKSK